MTATPTPTPNQPDDEARVHAGRRTPRTSAEPVDLPAFGRELLDDAASLAARRSARTLHAGAGATLKQSLLALCAGESLQEHVAPEPTTLLVIEGAVLLRDGPHRTRLSAGMWVPCPHGPHSLEAVSDAVVLLTVAGTPARHG